MSLTDVPELTALRINWLAVCRSPRSSASRYVVASVASGALPSMRVGSSTGKCGSCSSPASTYRTGNGSEVHGQELPECALRAPQVLRQIIGRNSELCEQHFRPADVVSEQRRTVAAHCVCQKREMVGGIFEVLVASRRAVALQIRRTPGVVVARRSLPPISRSVLRLPSQRRGACRSSYVPLPLRTEVREESDLRAFRHQLQSLGNAEMRLMMRVAAMPPVVALRVTPIGEQPEFSAGFSTGLKTSMRTKPGTASTRCGRSRKACWTASAHAVGDGEGA